MYFYLIYCIVWEMNSGVRINKYLADQKIASRREADALIEKKKVLVKLDEKYRQILTLRYFEHLEYDEISDVLKIPIGSVGTLIHRGKKQLYNELNQDSLRI